MGKEISNGTRFGSGKGGTDVLPEARGVGVGEKKKETWELDEDGRCKCGRKAAQFDRYCTNCGRLLLRDGKPLSEGEGPKRTGTPTEFFVSQGAVEMRNANGGVRSSQTSVDLQQASVEEDSAVRLDAGAVKAALRDAGGNARKVAEDEDETMAFEVGKDGKIRSKGPYKG